jgi:hypothetical protein
MKHTVDFPDGSKEEWYGVHEFYTMEHDGLEGWTQNPVDISGGSVEEIVWQLEAMIEAVNIKGVRCAETGELL